MEQQLIDPLDPKTKAVLKAHIAEVLPGLLFDAKWRSHFDFFTVFESIDRLYYDGGGSAALTDSEGLKLEVSALGATEANFFLLMPAGALIRHDKPTRFRCALRVTSIADMSASVYSLVPVSAVDWISVGIENGRLLGTVTINTVVRDIDLGAAAANTFYTLEYRYVPGDRVVFFVDGVEKGTLTNVLLTADPEGIFQFGVARSAAATKGATLAYVHFSQGLL